jgi:hypothetical protein
MVKEELVGRSPVRTFKQAFSGGLKAGEIGVISSPSGIGKTSVLVQIGLDFLLQNKKVIHVSFTQHADYVTSWYENIFTEFTKTKNLEGERDVKDEIVKNRVHMNFNQDGQSIDLILRSLDAMIGDGGFNAYVLIIDGLDFKKLSPEKVSVIKKFAKEHDLVVWASINVAGPESYDKRGIPAVLEPLLGEIDVVTMLEPKSDHVRLSVSKDRGVFLPKVDAIKLDPKTLLMMK